MKIGMSNGVFDLFHDGHHHYLARCKEHCDYLIIALNSDASVKRLKGATRPRQDWGTRMEAVMETGLVDAVIPFEGNWLPLAYVMRVDVVLQGIEYQGLKVEGVPTIFIERVPGYSTSLQIEALAAKTNA